ncbi:MAG: hypothetical protein HY682_04855 [Chloroflexi bacterium]|nr:hypothetical protein [Chloroflexota bacterium]
MERAYAVARLRRLIKPLLASLAVLLLLAGDAATVRTARAHPLGNFTVNRFSRLFVQKSAITVRYVLDMAEIPAFQEIRAIDANRNQIVDPEESESYLDRQVEALKNGLSLSVDGASRGLTIVQRDLAFPPGQGGLATLRIEAVFEASFPPRTGAGTRTMFYEDRNYPDRLGWKEIVAVSGAGARIISSIVPETSISDDLRSYPDSSLSSPLDVRSATVEFEIIDSETRPDAHAASGALAKEPTATPVPRGGFDPLSRLLKRDRLNAGLIALSLVLAAGIGSFHALTPGHGKTIMAAFLIGTRGTVRHAALLGLTVAVAHTAGVLGLGAVTLYAASTFAPESVYPWLGFGAGGIVLAIGLWLLASRLSGGRLRLPFGRQGHDHLHRDASHPDDSQPHSDAPLSDHTHESSQFDTGAPTDGNPGHSHRDTHGAQSTVTWRSLVAIGLADGAIPSASALIIWLAAISLDRVALGLGLVASFGLGMAIVLVAVGMLLVRGRGVFEARIAPRFPALQKVNRALPWATALVVIGAGLLLVWRAARQAGFI